MRAAQLLGPGGILVDEAHVVDRPERATLGAGAVVGHEHHDGVVGVAGRLEVREDAPDLVVGVLEERGEALHEAGGDGLVPGLEVAPRRHPRRTFRERGARGDDAELELTRVDPVAQRVPAVVEPAAVPRDPVLRRVVRRVAGTGAEVEEERLRAVDVAEVTEVLDGAVGEVLTEVVALLHRLRRLDGVVVAVQRRHVLVGLAAVEPVPPVEPAPEGPTAAVRGHVRLVVGREVPLPHRQRGVALRPQDLREEPVLERDLARVARVAHREVGDPAHPVAVVVHARQQARARRRAERGGVEVRQAHARRRERVDVRRVDLGAVAAELREADVVQHDQQHVGRTVGRLHALGPSRGRVAPVPADDPGESVVSSHVSP